MKAPKSSFFGPRTAGLSLLAGMTLEERLPCEKLRRDPSEKDVESIYFNLLCHSASFVRDSSGVMPLMFIPRASSLNPFIASDS